MNEWHKKTRISNKHHHFHWMTNVVAEETVQCFPSEPAIHWRHLYLTRLVVDMLRGIPSKHLRLVFVTPRSKVNPSENSKRERKFLESLIPGIQRRTTRSPSELSLLTSSLHLVTLFVLFLINKKMDEQGPEYEEYLYHKWMREYWTIWDEPDESWYESK
jgi:hypothetical protein